MARYRRLTPGELPRATTALAKALIGVVLIRDSRAGRCSGKIVETEAYVLRDPASHAYRGKSRRNASMFLAPFHAYIYKIYGTSFCFNVSSEDEAHGAAVLVRALEPIAGISLMVERRGTDVVRDLCRGPGRLCTALGIDAKLDGLNLLRGRELWLADAGFTNLRVRKSKRIGITKAAHRRLRFYEIGNGFISGPRRLSP